MKRITKYTALITVSLIILLLPACGGKKEDPVDNTPPQTLIFYFTGTKLSFYFYRNISAVKNAVRQDILGKSRILYLFQNTSKTQTELYELTYEEGLCKENLLQTYALPNIMDEQNLTYILKDVIRQAPSKSYGLVMAGHSTAWIPMDPISPTRSLLRDGSQPQISYEEYWRKNKGEYETRYFGERYSSSSSHGFDMSTFSKALTATGVKFDYILFDACFMSNVEALYDIRNNTRYAIGSPCEIMGDGFPYEKVIPLLMQNNGTSYDLKAVCYAYNQHYLEKLGFSGSVALIDCTQLESLASAMKKVNQAAQNEFDISQVQSYEGYTNHLFFDIGHYVNLSCANQSVALEFKKQLNRTIVAKYTLDKFYSNYGTHSGQYKIDTEAYTGLTTSLPNITYTEDYKLTAWYKAIN